MKVILKSGVKFRINRSEAKAISNQLLEDSKVVRIAKTGKTFVLSEIAAII